METNIYAYIVLIQRRFAMENFEELQNIDNFCKVIVKKAFSDESEASLKGEKSRQDDAVLARNLDSHFEVKGIDDSVPEQEEPLIDVFDEEDHIRILVQCRCREQQVTFHPGRDGITICREECIVEKNGQEMCNDVCRKLNLPTDKLQLRNMLFIIAKCNNNNTLEAMIPKIKQ